MRAQQVTWASLQMVSQLPGSIFTELEPHLIHICLPGQLHLRLSWQLWSSPSPMEDLQIHCVSTTVLGNFQNQRPENAALRKGWWKQSVHQPTRNGYISHTSGCFCHSFFLQVNQHKRKLADALVHQRLKNKTMKWRLPNSNLIQRNKEGITQQTSNPWWEDYAQGANSYTNHLPHLLPLNHGK